MAWLDLLINGIFTGIGTGIGSYFATTYAIKHIKRLEEKTAEVKEFIRSGEVRS